MEKFAGKYKDEINSDPNFRRKYNELCDQMGIDPIVSRKTIFSSLGFGDFYNELAVIDIYYIRWPYSIFVQKNVT